MDRQKTCLEKLAPKKFCCRFDLHVGCKIVGIILTVIMAVCTVQSIIQTVDLKECHGCAYNSWKHAYGYSISSCIYCGLMFLVNLWFLWGVRNEKKSIVLAWVVISGVWLVQTSCLLLVLIIKYREDVGNVSWICSFFFTIIFILVLAYFVLVGYGYWVELRFKLPINIPRKK